jgi:WD40 repeat protein
VKVWKMPEGRVDATLLGHTGIVHCVVVTDNNLAVSGSDDKSLRVWDIRQRTCVNAVYGAHDNTICSLTISGNRLYSGSYREVAVWDMSSCLSQKWAPISVLSGHGHWVYSMQVLNDRYLAAGAHSLIRIWDLESFTSVQDVRTRVGKSIYALALTEDKDTLLAGTFENALLMGHVEQGEEEGDPVRIDEPRAIMDAHSACVLCLAVSGDIVFSGSYDTTVKMWRLGSDRRLTSIGSLDHGAKVESLVVSDKFIVSGGTDGVINVWTR